MVKLVPMPEKGPPRESDIQDQIRKALGREPDLWLMRNIQTYVDETARDGSPRRYKAGLGTGSADLVGILTRNGEGVFFALEVKRPGAKGASEEQDKWIGVVRRRKGFAAVVWSVEDAWAALARAREGGCA